ncbi:hypothetical protein TSTA_039710 [Talaromyces stipitatus ATCC 10500]|uniref:Uncharacterized protein n=1 Tax=Talaromyces stipitatus (strain ATCC 10500 / CBS 375.48 / QM 6759 / NRRL 1006) TaxID=441959 RepID=B8M433_TALSN|nr:uncharacterized protein TSTA_039710 [Talaromyces stipitatus ATCC 10500]EED20776.1 hypothetical protein TSTA_039710 [Talaromyces stipitatus ATCC 10500]
MRKTIPGKGKTLAIGQVTADSTDSRLLFKVLRGNERAFDHFRRPTPSVRPSSPYLVSLGTLKSKQHRRPKQ